MARVSMYVYGVCVWCVCESVYGVCIWCVCGYVRLCECVCGVWVGA